MAKTFEVKYSFKCPESGCLKQTINTMTIAAPDSADASELAIAGLACEYCHKKLPRGYFVHTSAKEIK